MFLNCVLRRFASFSVVGSSCSQQLSGLHFYSLSQCFLSSESLTSGKSLFCSLLKIKRLERVKDLENIAGFVGIINERQVPGLFTIKNKKTWRNIFLL